MDGRSGSLISLMRCGMFISLTAETARAGAAAIPAYQQPTNNRTLPSSYSHDNEQFTDTERIT